MQKILFPTDFSDNALGALEYAIEMINHLGGKLYLFSAYKVSSRADMFVSLERHIQKDVEEQMDQLREKVEPRLNENAQLEVAIVRGETISSIVGFADQQKIDYIVMGTQGASGLKEVFIGSTTGGVIQGTRRPVLAIPNGYTYRPIERMVLALDDMDISSHQVVLPLTRLAKNFDSNVLVYHLEKGSDDKGIDPSVEIFLDGIEHSFHYELKGEDVNESISAFVADYRGDVLCMIHRGRGFLQKILQPSFTRREVFDSSVPLLILHDDSSSE